MASCGGSPRALASSCPAGLRAPPARLGAHFNVRFNAQGGRFIEVRVPENATVKAVKTAVEDQEGIAVESMSICTTSNKVGSQLLPRTCVSATHDASATRTHAPTHSRTIAPTHPPTHAHGAHPSSFPHGRARSLPIRPCHTRPACCAVRADDRRLGETERLGHHCLHQDCRTHPHHLARSCVCVCVCVSACVRVCMHAYMCVFACMYSPPSLHQKRTASRLGPKRKRESLTKYVHREGGGGE